MINVSVCLLSDALSTLNILVGFLLTLDVGYLLTVAPPDLKRGVAPVSPPAPVQPQLLGYGVAPLGCHP